MKRKIFSFTIIILIVFSTISLAYAADVTIPDANLRAALYSISGTPTSQPLTTDILAAITGDVDLSNKDISDITGIHYLTGATSIDLSLNKIGSIPRNIENLTLLEVLDISGNRITRLPSNLGNMSGLMVLDIRANRLDELTSSLSKLNLSEFYCDYNFFDLTDDSDDMNIINSISATTKEYTHQLAPLTGYSAYSPENGTIVLYWDKIENIMFDNSTVGKVGRIVVLDESYSYIGEASPDNRTFKITGLDPTKEYTYYISADYYVLLTKYDKTYTKLYRTITAKAVPENTPEPNQTPTPTPTVEPTVSPTDSPEPQTPTPTIAATDTPVPQTTSPSPTKEPEKNSIGLKILYFFIAVLVIAFLFVTVSIIVRAVSAKSNNRRYRR